MIMRRRGRRAVGGEGGGGGLNDFFSSLAFLLVVFRLVMCQAWQCSGRVNVPHEKGTSPGLVPLLLCLVE